MKTTVYPQTVFGVFSALSGPLLTTAPSPPGLYQVICRVPKIVIWIWLNLLIFTLANQRLPDSILEDRVNKPWRNLPSGRVTPAGAKRLLLYTLPAVFGATVCFIGGVEENLLMIMLSWMYCELGGAEEHFFVKNAFNAAGYTTNGAASLRLASGFPEHTLNDTAYKWIAMMCGIIASTIQIQDLQDQEGDRARGRNTAPLSLGDGVTRWSVSVLVFMWSCFCPAFWQLGIGGYILPICSGVVVARRLLLFRSPKADERSFAMWCFWLGTIYILPLWKNHEALSRMF